MTEFHEEDKKRDSAREEGPEADGDGSMEVSPPLFTGWDRAVSVRDEKTLEEETGTGPEPRKNTLELDTPKGRILIENRVPAVRLEALAVDDGICMFSRHNPERQKKALINVANSEGGNVVAGMAGDLLVSYIGIHHPSDRERWGKPGYPWLYEFGAIEVSRNYRGIKLAEAMLDAAFDDPFYDDKIMLTTGFVWHWDLEETGLTKMQYRDLGLRLFGRYGFMEMATDEPNVTMDSANLFMVRIGKNASFSRYQKFASLLFANEWEAMLRGF